MINAKFSGSTSGGGFDTPDHNRFVESDTSLRYTLSNPKTGSTDRIVPHPSGKIRIVEYPDQGLFRRNILEKLIDQDLMIGKLFSDDDDLAFKIPLSARPLAYEASQRVAGEYSYNDDKLFYDLGRLLGKLSRLRDDDVLVVREDIGKVVAIVDFTQPGEKHLGFVPGAENIIDPLLNVDDALNHYNELLGREFGNTYFVARESFEAGYSRAINNTKE